ncbi:hypothetical protein [Escherichia coli]|uniref:hypothetical protein n=1 Tax=Escherichia coli TaxID=562 RepID=UPI00203529C7|nr:hypothetical protein [Escherichia coli]
MAAIKMGVLMNNQLSEICSDSIVSMVKKGVRRFKRPEVGDLFTLEMQDIGFIHGMVARNDLEFVKGQADFNIIYIYKEITKTKVIIYLWQKANLCFHLLLLMTWHGDKDIFKLMIVFLYQKLMFSMSIVFTQKQRNNMKMNDGSLVKHSNHVLI